MATFYIQLENKLLQISGDLTNENISKALGYVPVSPNVTNELSQRVDNITFDNLKDNPFLQDGSGELNIVDEAGNIIAKIDADGIHSVDFIAGNHKLTDKIDSSALNGYAKESWVTAEITKAATEGKVDLTGYATEEWVENKNYLTEHQDISHLATKEEVSNIDFYEIKDNPIVNNGDGKLLFVDEQGYIGLQLEEDGLYVKDVIADGHKLSDKANVSDIPSLSGYAKESWVNTNLQNYATKDEVSDLVDMSVVTELQGKVDTLVGEDADKSVRDIAVDVLTETLVSETATEAYDTLAEMSDWIKSHPEDAAAMNTAIQKNATDITNLDAAYKAADAKVLTDAQEYTDNINFYTIKDNPIVDGEAGSITFVDETGYIGLKVTEDGIIAKDVVTPEHTLSSKADKSFVEDNYYNKSTVDKKITEAVTGGQVSLDGFATEQWVNEQGFLKEHQDISQKADKSELPTKTSDLTNDSGYLTEHQDISHLATKAEIPTVPTKVSELENDSKFITINDIPEVTVPTKTSDLTNDSGFITINDVPVLEIPEEYVTETELNDKGFLTEHQDISHLASRNWVELQGYAHQEDLLEISFNDIQDSPISIDDSGMINFVDESGNVGFQINEEGLRVTDVIAGDHKLSEKANASDIPSLDGYAKTEDIPSLDGLVKSGDLPNFDEFAKTEDIPSLDDYASKEWVNNKNYATEYELKTIDYSSINNVPVSEDGTGELNIADESGNIGMKVASEAVYAKDFVAGEHKLSEKVDKSYVDSIKSDNVYVTEFSTDELYNIIDTETPLPINKDGLIDAVNSHKIIIIPYSNEYETNGGGYIANVQDYGEYIWIYINNSFFTIEFVIYRNEPIKEITIDDIAVSYWQNELISGENIRTINGEDIIGDGSNMELATKDELNAKADDSSVVHLEGDEIIWGTKKFTSRIETPNGILFDPGTHIESYNEVNGETANVIGYTHNALIVNDPRHPLYLHGSDERAKYNNEDMAMFSDVEAKQDALISGINIKTINGESILGSGDITISGGNSDANIQAVDTGDVIDDVNVDYATKTYVDGLVGDINSVLESIINGGNTPALIDNYMSYMSKMIDDTSSYYFLLEYPAESDLVIKATYSKPNVVNGTFQGYVDVTEEYHIDKGNMNINEVISEFREFTNVSIIPEYDNVYRYIYNA